VIHYLDEGAMGFVTAELASPGEYRAPHVLAFEVLPHFLLRCCADAAGCVAIRL
jgi:hypothetical protein